MSGVELHESVSVFYTIGLEGRALWLRWKICRKILSKRFLVALDYSRIVKRAEPF